MANELTPVTFRAHTKLAYAIWALFLVATVAAAWANSRKLIGWGWPLGCGLFAILFIPSLRRLRSLYLHLDEEGLETASHYMEKLRIRWGEVEEIEVVTTDPDPGKGREAIRIVYATPAKNVLLIENEYSTPLEEIRQTLDTCRERYTRAA
jgi:hypothetical protein